MTKLGQGVRGSGTLPYTVSLPHLLMVKKCKIHIHPMNIINYSTTRPDKHGRVGLVPRK